VSPALQGKKKPQKETPFDEKAVMREAYHDAAAAAAVVLLQREGGRGRGPAAAAGRGGGGESH